MEFQALVSENLMIFSILLGAIRKKRLNISGAEVGLKFRSCKILEGRARQIRIEILTWVRGV